MLAYKSKVTNGPSPGATVAPVKLNPTTTPFASDLVNPSVLAVVLTLTMSIKLLESVNWNPATGSSLDIPASIENESPMVALAF